MGVSKIPPTKTAYINKFYCSSCDVTWWDIWLSRSQESCPMCGLMRSAVGSDRLIDKGLGRIHCNYGVMPDWVYDNAHTPYRKNKIRIVKGKV